MYGGVSKTKLREFKEMEKENARLKRIVADPELEKLTLKESLDYLKPKACRSPTSVRPLFMSVRNWTRLSGEPAKWPAPVASTQRYTKIKEHDCDEELNRAMTRLVKQYGRYGYRKIAHLMRIEGWLLNHK